VLDLRLIDKLELLIGELKSSGVDVRRMAVMSGFRTPQYNANGGLTAGRASLSRHMYGDAADVYVDNNGNGRMDDLNGDGRVDHRDAQVLLDAVVRVERKYPQLVGGVGLYRANASHGPFAHVDVRGTPARWGVGL
ncbi:MAG TPA: D-Ala-D-Ala carboxypeptidase family metallohydrolase, partial [Gemmatimonadaceae bacterium]|nr:D-Ala-D-Ala carboxypeptidase family metallohydrolase [Gemmatimonadaceae bacterium]